jgi:hypothetical protein
LQALEDKIGQISVLFYKLKQGEHQVNLEKEQPDKRVEFYYLSVQNLIANKRFSITNLFHFKFISQKFYFKNKEIMNFTILGKFVYLS